MKLRKVFALLLTLVLICSALAGCGAPASKETATPPPATATQAPPQTTAPAEEKTLTIALAMDKLSPYWIGSLVGMEEQAAEENVQLVLQAADGDANKQAQQIENFLAQKVDAIICVPNDGKAIISSVKRAQEEGIPILLLERPLAPNAEGVAADYMCASDNVKTAQIGGEWLLEKAKSSGETMKMLVLEGSLTDQNAADRKTGLTMVTDENSDVLQVVQSVPCENWNPDVAMAATANAFQANPDLNCIVAFSDALLPGVMSGLKQVNRYVKAGEAGHVTIISINGDTFALDNLRDGYIDMDLAFKTIEIARKVVSTAVKLANGETVSAAEERMEAFIIDAANYSERSNDAFGYYIVGKEIQLLK